MAESDRLLGAIEAVQAAGLDEALWPAALASVTKLFGAVGASFEVVHRPTRELRDFWSFGLPQACEMGYADHFMSVSPRVTFGLRQSAGEIGYDYMMIDEDGMRRDAFYSEFLPGFDLRYFVSVAVNPTPQDLAAFAVQRSPRQGHVANREIVLMQRLAPHLRLAFDTTMRLRGAGERANAFKDALDWLADGVLLVCADGTMTYANNAIQAIARRNDGIRIVRDQIEFKSAESRSRFAAALAAIARLRAGDVAASIAADFPVPRPSGAMPYVVSLRPLSAHARGHVPRTRAIAVVFVRDPLGHDTAAARIQRELFGFTEAESGLACALRAGIPLGQYARERAVSLNTVYTHLRRIKQKTGCSRMSELIRKLNDLQVRLRPSDIGAACQMSAPAANDAPPVVTRR